MIRPHLIDKVEIIEKNTRIIAWKTFVMSEPFFEHHFDGNPVVPGAFLLEAVADAASVLLEQSDEEHRKSIPIMINNVKFRHFAGPGDHLRIEIEVKNLGAKVISTEFNIKRNETLIAVGDMIFNMHDNSEIIPEEHKLYGRTLHKIWLREAKYIGFDKEVT